ncbi:MAG: S8 family peptidase [Lachnospiraceae bacterium]
MDQNALFFENDQKRENLLNLSLQATEEDRNASLELGVGVSESSRWELVLKYHGDLQARISQIEQRENTNFYLELLLPGYAIVNVLKEWINLLSELPEIDYIEKPKALYEEAVTLSQGKIAACIPEVTERGPKLTGEGVLLGIPDSGIDYTSRIFRDEQGNSRIRFLWDQSKAPDPSKGEKAPEGFWEGVEYSREQLDQSIRDMQNRNITDQNITDQNVTDQNMAGAEELSFDRSGHGSAVAAIAGGQGGVAEKSGFLIVKLGSGNPQGFTRTTELMRAVTWMLRKAQQLAMPLAINISYGSTYGAHDGSSLLEQFLNTASDTYKTVLCVGSGNEGAAAGHLELELIKESGSLEDVLTGTRQKHIVEWNIAPYQSSISLAIWKNYADEIDVALTSPGGRQIVISLKNIGKQVFEVEQTRILFYLGDPTPYSRIQEYYFDFIGNPYVANGIWQLEIRGIRIRDGKLRMYLPSDVVLNQGTGFFRPTPTGTFTIPGTAEKVITVGAYNTVYREYADFSGRGFENMETAQKPDLVAPGVDLLVPDRTGGYTSVTGTSFAAPFVTGSCALLMEWGIVRGNDPFLYGEKLKAYLIGGTEELRGSGLTVEESETGVRYPNAQVGWGTLCLAKSLPE